MSRQKISTFEITLFAAFTAIIFILAFTPLGLIPVGAITMTTLHIPVIVGGIVLGVKFGTLLGGIMGVATLLKALLMPGLPTDALFLNPVVSVIPRLILGFAAAGAYALLAGFTKGYTAKTLPIIVSAIIGTMTNTALVLGALAIIYPEQSGAAGLFIIVFTSNFPLEVITAIVLSIPICIALFRIKQRTIKYN